MKSDKYRKARGGFSRILVINCGNCGEQICRYQKDGPGILKRLYLDRISGQETESEDLICPVCNELLGVKIIYKKENRPAYRLYVGSITKKITRESNI